MTRAVPATLALAFIAALLIFDLARTPPIPYQAPAFLAFGSGSAASGGFCGALPN